MEIADLLTGPDAVLASVKASGKKALLAELAARCAAMLKLDERRLFDRLLERERLGSTGIGGGIAIPHGRMSTLAQPRGLFARLAHPIDFDSIDRSKNQPRSTPRVDDVPQEELIERARDLGRDAPQGTPPD